MKERANPVLRFFDRYIGIILLLFLSFFKKRKKWPSSIRSVAFLKSAGIGDAILLSAVIQDLLKEKQGTQVFLFTGLSNREISSFLPFVQVIPLPMTKPLKALKVIRQYEVDLWIDCDPWPRINALFSFFSRSRFTLGFKTQNQFKHLLFDSYVSHSFACHELENYRKLVRAFGIECSLLPDIPFPSAKEQKACKIALHIFSGGSRGYLKEWPQKHWIKVIQFLVSKKMEVVLTGSQEQYEPLQNLYGHLPVVNWAGKLSLVETASLLKECAAVISVDTGIMHLAAALHVKVISLHGPTSPKRWGGLGENVFALTPDIEYIPCIQLGFENLCKNNICMQSISPEKVIAELKHILWKEETYVGIDSSGRERDETLASFSK